MVIAAFAVMIVFPNPGLWFGGREYEVRLSIPNGADLEEVDMVWRFVVDDTAVAWDRVRVELRDGDVVAIVPPAVRVPTDATWSYTLLDPSTEEVLEWGEQDLRLYPTDLLSTIAGRADKRMVVVAEDGDPLVAMLIESGVVFERVDEATQLPLRSVDLVIVAPGADDMWGFDQTTLLRAAEAGATVLILERAGLQELFEMPVTRYPNDAELIWDARHPFLTDLAPPIRGAFLYPVVNTSGRPLVEIVEIKPAYADDTMLPVFALLAIRDAGRGRLVFSQLPWHDWQADPRSQLLLRNIIYDTFLDREPRDPQWEIEP